MRGREKKREREREWDADSEARTSASPIQVDHNSTLSLSLVAKSSRDGGVDVGQRSVAKEGMLPKGNGVLKAVDRRQMNTHV